MQSTGYLSITYTKHMLMDNLTKVTGTYPITYILLWRTDNQPVTYRSTEVLYYQPINNQLGTGNMIQPVTNRSLTDK